MARAQNREEREILLTQKRRWVPGLPRGRGGSYTELGQGQGASPFQNRSRSYPPGLRVGEMVWGGGQEEEGLVSQFCLESQKNTTLWGTQRQHEEPHKAGGTAWGLEALTAAPPDHHSLYSKTRKDPEVPMSLSGEQPDRMTLLRVGTKRVQATTLWPNAGMSGGGWHTPRPTGSPCLLPSIL